MPTYRNVSLCLVVVAVIAVGCSGAEPLDLAEFPPDAVLDCTDDSNWGVSISHDPEAEGFATASDALADTFTPFIEDDDELQGPEQLREDVGSLLNAQNREVVVAIASELSPDNWFVTTLSGCSGFEQF